MNSEHRHQLSQNDLANWMLEFYEDTLRPNASIFFLGVVCVVVVVAGVMFYTRTAAANKAAAWRLYNEACSAGDGEVASLEQLATLYTSGEMGAMVRFTLAEAYCASVSTPAGRERPDAIATLEKAVGLLDVAARLTTDLATQGRIAYNRGVVFETLATLRTPPAADATPDQKAEAIAACTADLEHAVTAYKAAVTVDANGAYAASAQARLDAIQNPIVHEALIAIATTPIPLKASEGGSVLNINTQTAPEPPTSLDLEKLLE